MCKQTVAFLLLILGLVFLLLCFTPTWLICVLGLILIAVGVVWIVLKLRKGR